MAVGCIARRVCSVGSYWSVVGAVAGHGRPLRVERASVPAAGGVPDRPGPGERHRLGQLGRHSWRQRQRRRSIGWIKDVTGSFEGGLYALAALGLMAAIVAALCVRETAAKLAAEDALEAT